MNQEQRTKLWNFVAAAALVAALSALVAVGLDLPNIPIWTPPEEAVPRAYQCDVYTEQGCAKYVVASGGELEVRSGGVLDVQEGATFAPYFTGDLVLENSEGISNSLDGDVFVNGSLLGYTNIVSQSASYTLAITESGSLAINIGAAGEITWTLPAAAAGLHYCFYIAPTQNITIVVGAADQIHHLTNAAGDRLQNGTAGDSICLTAIDIVYWIPTGEEGTWNDAD